MSSDALVAEKLHDIEHEMCRMIAGVCAPYDAAWNIWGMSMSLVAESPDVMHPLWLIWGSLTDWVENRPAETKNAELEMIRAAREWLDLDQADSRAKEAFLNRWVYDEM